MNTSSSAWDRIGVKIDKLKDVLFVQLDEYERRERKIGW